MTSNDKAAGLFLERSKPVLGIALPQPEAALLSPERLVQPDAWAGHIPFAFWLVAAMRPRRYVELGVHTGNSYCAVAQAIARYGVEADCFGIDHWFGDEHAGLYGEDIYAELSAWHNPRYGHFSTLLRMSFAEGLDHVADGSVDLLHIDGLHTYEAVREDFETWEKKLSDRSIVLFHDTNVRRDDFGVWRYWGEIQDRFPAFEFLHSNGLGVAYVGRKSLGELPPGVAALFRLATAPVEREVIRAFFSGIGDSLAARLQLDDTSRRGEETTRRLYKIERERLTLDAERLALAGELERLREKTEKKTEKWDRLTEQLGNAIAIDPEQLGNAFMALHSRGDERAVRDLATLQRQLDALVRKGTVKIDYNQALRQVVRTLKGRPRDDKQAETPREELFEHAGLFEESHYAQSAEARAAGMDPLQHYLAIGEAQGIAPSAHFDPDYYARRYPDVAASGQGLLHHYVRYGKDEGRMAVAPAQRLVLPELPETGLPRVLLVLDGPGHDDNAVLAWNLARDLSPTHSMVAVFGAGVALRDAIATACAAAVDLPREHEMSRLDRDNLMARLVEAVRPAFALTVGSGEFVRGLAMADVGVVHLIDDIAGSPAGPSLHHILPWAHRLVVPDVATKQTFARAHPILAQRRFDILPPKATRSPFTAETGFGSAAYDEALRKRLRPAGYEDAFLVVGTGEISARKGTDLFVDTAAAAIRASGGKLRFVWIAPQGRREGGTYSGLLGEQIARSRVADQLEIIDDLDSYEEAFRQADAFVLTSRVDPLPLDAINAAAAGIPVVCFDRASSLSEEVGRSQAAELAVPYLDTHVMAQRLCALIEDKAVRAAARQAMVDIAKAFDGERYSAEIARLGREAQETARRIAEEHAALRAAPGAFSETMFRGSWPEDTDPQDSLKHHLVRWHNAGSGDTLPAAVLRRPVSGFHPTIYAEDALEGNLTRSPLLDWIEKGRPEGRWTHRVIALDGFQPRSVPVKALLHGHFYHTDFIEDFLTRLNQNASVIDLILTTSDEARADMLRAALGRNPIKGKADVVVVPNIGRDIAPFLTGLDRELLSGYEIVGHVHGKKTQHVGLAKANQWRSFLWEHTVGGQVAAADACLDALAGESRVGLVFPEDANLWGWGGNHDAAVRLAARMGLDTPLPQAFEYPIGTMFWARRNALEPLFALGLRWEDYPAEPLPIDGTMLHALERLIPLAVEKQGFDYATTHLATVQNCAFE